MDSLSQFIKQREQETLLREKKFPLRCLLLLYTQARYSLYIDYLAGFRVLVGWLSPIQVPPYNPSAPFSPLLYNYEQQEIARILNCDPRIIQQTFLSLALENTNERT